MADAPPRYRCLLCEDGRWVCADHPTVAWNEGFGCECGAEGVKCPLCNPNADMPPGALIVLDSSGRLQ